MQIGSSGGGYFYGPFTSTQIFGPYAPVPAVGVGVYGAWAHLVAPILTGKGRWIEIFVTPPAYGSIYGVQLGLGSVGNEVLFQPSTGPSSQSGFYIDWFGAIKWSVPFRIAFPTSVGNGKEISVRCASAPGGGLALSVLIYLWN